jgi:glycosyltransferase involved in cell wall biosynthesis
MRQPPPAILFLVTEDWYFCLHRLPIARAARDAGFRVMVATQVRDHGGVLEGEGFEVIPMRWTRGSLNPLHTLSELRQIIGIYRKCRPDLVHHVALRPSIYGSIAAALTGVSPVVNNLAGLGLAFSSTGVSAGLVRAMVTTAFRLLFGRPGNCTVVENSDDRAFLINKVGLDADSVILIRGIGVDTRRFAPTPERLEGVPVVTLVSRMLWPKGIGELVEAARILRERGVAVKVRLVGMPDTTSRVSVPEQQLAQWNAQGVVEWLGHRDDIPELWRTSTIAVLPSYYREGVPRSLLEAAACGRAIVTTDMPGCREIVQHGINGLLVPPRDARAIAAAIEELVADPAMRQRMGVAGRALVEKGFSEEYIVEQTLAVYQSLVDDGVALALNR